MESTENQPVVNYRDQLVDRMKSKFPDRNYDSTDGTTSPNSLEESIIEAFNEIDGQVNDLTARNKVYEENTAKITNLFKNSPRGAVFLNELAATGNPAAAIYKAYGKEAHAAFMEGDASDLISKIEEEDAKRRADNDAFEAEKEENFSKSMEVLSQFGADKGLSEDEMVDLFMQAHGFASDAVVGTYSTEFFDMLLKAKKYDDDVASARHEGEVNGRNARIVEQARKREQSAAMPPKLSGQGVRNEERRPQRTNDNPWML